MPRRTPNQGVGLGFERDGTQTGKTRRRERGSGQHEIEHAVQGDPGGPGRDVPRATQVRASAASESCPGGKTAGSPGGAGNSSWQQPRGVERTRGMGWETLAGWGCGREAQGLSPRRAARAGVGQRVDTEEGGRERGPWEEEELRGAWG